MTTPFPFQSAAVLTSAQMNAITTLPVSTKTGSYTLTVADVGYRIVMNSASATTITVNTSIFGASDVVEILNIGAGVCTVTAGTCTVGTSGSLALAQNAGGTLTFISASASVFVASATPSGLILVSSTTIGTGVSSVTISNAFSATYDNYKIIISGGSASGDGAIKMTLGSTATGYYAFLVYGAYTAATVIGVNTSNGSSWIYSGGYESGQLYANIDLTAPFLTETTDIRATVRYATVYGNTVGVLANGTSYTAFTLTPDGAHTWTGATVRVYGYQNS